MNKSSLIGALCAGVLSFLTMTSSVVAATADDVKCRQCVNGGDIAKKAVNSSKIKAGAVTKSKIKDGAVTESKLSSGVLDLISANEATIEQNSITIGINESNIAQNTANIGATASDVLTNSLDITDIKTDVAKNTAATAALGSVYVMANGQPIGLLVGSVGANIFPYRVLSDTNYFIDIGADGDLTDAQSLFYVFPDCSGQAYSSADQYRAWQGYVFKPRDPTDIVEVYYVAKNTTGESLTAASVRNDQGCSNISSSRGLFPAFPNDPAITGTPNGPFETPITIGH